MVKKKKDLNFHAMILYPVWGGEKKACQGINTLSSNFSSAILFSPGSAFHFYSFY
jgi:hypothetical protein